MSENGCTFWQYLSADGIDPEQTEVSLTSLMVSKEFKKYNKIY